MMNMTSLADALTDSLPTRDDVIQAIGLATRRSAPVELASGVGVFGARLLVGARLALRFALSGRFAIEMLIRDLSGGSPSTAGVRTAAPARQRSVS